MRNETMSIIHACVLRFAFFATYRNSQLALLPVVAFRATRGFRLGALCLLRRCVRGAHDADSDSIALPFKLRHYYSV